MSRWHSYLNSATAIISEYDGRIPLAAWLKDYFKLHKQMGSTDRKMIAELAYSFYRLGHAVREVPAATRMLAGLFCCNQSPFPLLQHLKPEWHEAMHLPLPEKLGIISRDTGAHAHDLLRHIFPWKHELCHGIDAEAFSRSFLQQPDLFLRVRPGKENKVLKQLAAAGINFPYIADRCIALPNGTRVESLISIGGDAIVQDYSSQRTGSYFGLGRPESPPLSLWDCCAASGGKSIMAYDLDPRIRLTVSDVRESILHNLHQRFKEAGIAHYHSFVADLTRRNPVPPTLQPDVIIADLPCSGSGTWARTPEQLYFFKPEQIGHYSELQKNILANVVPHLAPGGRLVYITCSVFKKENEAAVQFIQSQFGLRLSEMQLLTGYALKADTLFVAVFDH